MKMKNQIFDWNRFVAALRKEVVENWRTLLFSAIGIYALLALLMILGNLTIGDSTARPELMLRYVMVYVVFSFGGIGIASLAFRGLKTKAGRIELLTSPSSTFEKFLVNTVVYVLGFIVAFPICAQLADLTRIAILWPWSGGQGVPGPVNFLTTIHEFAFQQDWWPQPAKGWFEIALWLSNLAGPGLYLLGSILWPRLSFLKTYAAIFAIQSVLVIMLMIGIKLFSDMGTFGKWLMGVEQTTGMMWLAVWSAAQLVLCWALAWWLWKRKDVISLKWWS